MYNWIIIGLAGIQGTLNGNKNIYWTCLKAGGMEAVKLVAIPFISVDYYEKACF